MSKKPSTFRLRDLRTAALGVRQAGISIRRVEVDRAGKIVIVTGEPEPAEEPAVKTARSTDDWLAELE
jgi:hypothetical protein